MVLRFVFLILLTFLLQACGETGSTSEDEPEKRIPHIVIENRFAQDLYLEFWTGSALEYDNGQVKGYHLQRVTEVEINARQSTNLIISQTEDWLIVIGLKEDNQFYYLQDDVLYSVSDGDIISITASAQVEHLSLDPEIDITDEAVSTENNLEFDETTEQNLKFAVIKYISTQAKAVHKASAQMIKLMKDMSLTDQLDSIQNDTDSETSVESGSWIFLSGNYSQDINDTVEDLAFSSKLKTSFLWPADIEGHNKGDLITQDMRQQANYFTNLDTTLQLDSLNMTFDSKGELAKLFGVPANIQSPFSISGVSDVFNWMSDVYDNVNGIQWNRSIALQSSSSMYQIDVNFSEQSAFNIYLNPLTLEYRVIPFDLKLVVDTSSLTDLTDNESIKLNTWSIVLDHENHSVSQVIDFSVTQMDGLYEYDGEIFIDGGVDETTFSESVFLRNSSGEVIYIQ